MGKRRTDAPHKDRYDESDSEDDVVEEQPELEPLNEEQKSNIQGRKKLVAKRRIGAGSESSSGSSLFSSNPSPFSFLSKPTDSTDDKPEKSTFAGFKGFTAFKSTNIATPSTATTVNSTLSSTSTITTSAIPSTGIKFGPLTSEKPTGTEEIVKPISLTNGTKPSAEGVASFSFLNSKPTQSSLFQSNGDHKKEEKQVEMKKTETVSSEETTKTTGPVNKNISEGEIKFINELNDLYERCFGPNKRTYKLPIDALNESGSSDQETKYACLLAELNKHCSKWISKHVEESPLVILTPVFVDYFNYLILLEKQFFPSTFSKKTETAAEKPTLSTQQPIFNSQTNKTPSFNNLLNGKAANGHKEIEEKKSVEILDDTDKAKENEDIYETTKKLPNLVKSQTPFTPISLSKTNTLENPSFKFGSTAEKTTSLFFKATETETENETKKITETPVLNTFSLAKATAGTNTLKFGLTTSSVTFEKPIEEKKEEEKISKPNIFSSFSSSTSFNFGSSATTQTLAETKSEEKKSEDTVDSKVAPKPEVTAQSSFFSSLNKPATASSTEEDKSKQPETQPSIFKSFSGFSNLAATPSPFPSFGASSTATTPSATSTSTTTTASSTSTPFNFGSNLGGAKPSIFGSTTFGSGGGDFKSIFGSNTTPFAGAAATTFGSGTVASGEGGGDAEEEPYEPPKPETSDTKEEGAVFEKRIKLYYFSDKEKKFCDRGIGNLFIKPTSNGDSTQLIIRADTKLANILLNVKLSKVFPVNKEGPKDVSYLCVPNPPIPNVSQTAPCKFLFKVKTEDDAKELLEKLNEYKK